MREPLNNNFFLKDGGYSNYENTTELPRHRWYYYKEGFSPLLVEKAIEAAGITKKDLIIDPFNGSGTTTLTAALNNINSIGIEVNPFTSFLSDAKTKNSNSREFQNEKNRILSKVSKGQTSSLLHFSTFSKSTDVKKWLFNDSVLNSFEGGWQGTKFIASYSIRKLIRLGLITAAMQNCNAKRDGKCLRYRKNWTDNGFNKESFLFSLESILDDIISDIEAKPTSEKSLIINGDCRTLLKSKTIEKFKLCITSPPYLNTFDYTDIYRPELFLGKFVDTYQQLYNLRLKTVRSHIQAKWDLPTTSDFGNLYETSIQHINANQESLMHKNIPLMIQAYFEDMFTILKQLKLKALPDAQLWLVVSNSAYANMEIPVDLIIGDLGAKAGWYLKEIGVMRHIKRRKTKYSPDVNELRESVIILTADKKSK